MTIFGKKKKKSFPGIDAKENEAAASPSTFSASKSMTSALARMMGKKSHPFRSPKAKLSPGSPVSVTNVADSDPKKSEDEDIFKIYSNSTDEDEPVHHSVTSLPPLSANMRALEARTFRTEIDEGSQANGFLFPDRLEKKRTPRSQGTVEQTTDSSLTGHWIIDVNSLVLGRTIGHSSFGAVTEGKFNGTKVAVKTIQRDSRPGVPNNLDVIKTEAELNCQLRHPNVVLFMGISVEPEQVCIVTELMARGNVRDLLLRESKQGLIRLDWSLRQNWALDTAQGMAYLHSLDPPMIHRDLKTTNLLVDRGMNVKICDFGLSRFRSDQLMSAVGTVHFAAPEVLRNEQYTEKADLFSFGTVLWELQARKAVFKGVPQIEIFDAVLNGSMPKPRTDCDPRFADVMYKCWSNNPDKRPSFCEVIDILTVLVDETPEASV